jgi:hypothetical protein
LVVAINIGDGKGAIYAYAEGAVREAVSLDVYT